MTVRNPLILDVESLLERCMGNLEFAERILGKFQQRAGNDLEELEKLLELHDAERLARVAHRFKGSAANVSAEGLRRIAEQIEESGRAGRLADVPAQIMQLRREWVRYVDCSASLPSVAGVPRMGTTMAEHVPDTTSEVVPCTSW